MRYLPIWYFHQTVAIGKVALEVNLSEGRCIYATECANETNCPNRGNIYTAASLKRLIELTNIQSDTLHQPRPVPAQTDFLLGKKRR